MAEHGPIRLAKNSGLHGEAQSDVIRVLRIGAAIAIENEPALLDTILVGRSRPSTIGTVVIVSGISVRTEGLKMP